MVKSVIVSLDGSELSEKALPYALKLANTLKVKLTLLRVVNVADFPDYTFQRGLEDANEYLAYLKKFLAFERDNPLLTINPDFEVLMGDPAEEICRYVQKEAGALLVMTTHGRTGFSRLLVGSVAGEVLRKLRLPVLLVRPFGLKQTHTLEELLDAQDEPYARTFLENGSRLLVPLDQTARSEAALAPAFALATALSAPVNLMTVYQPPENILYGESISLAFSPEEMERREEMARDTAMGYLGQVAQKAHAKGVETQRQVFAGDPYVQITEYAGQIEPDLIVMATHARGEVGRLIFGSVANKLLQNTHLPVLMVPATLPGGQAAAGVAADTATE
jgi:nucleotide-binding universal stress UspA family protein